MQTIKTVLGRFLVVVAVLLACAPGMVCGQGFVVKDSKPIGQILVPEKASETITFAGQELAGHIKAMTGADMAVIADPGGALPEGSIRLALAADAVKELPLDGSEEHFVLDQAGKGVLIEGRSDIAVLYGAYEYLSGLGVRWFIPGDIGTHIPKRPDLPLDGTRKSIKPAMRIRQIWLNGNPDWHLNAKTPETLAPLMLEEVKWRLRNRLQVTAKKPRKGPPSAFPMNLTTTHDAFSHNIRNVITWTHTTLEKSPDRYPLVIRPDGKRERTDKGQICFTNQENIDQGIAWALDYFQKNPDQITASFSLQDTAGICQCDACFKANGSQDTTQDCNPLVWGYMNKVAAGIKAKRPDRGIAFYSSYGALTGPPTGLKTQGYIMGVVCHISGNNRDMNDTTDPFTRRMLVDINSLKNAGAQVCAREYTTFPPSPQPFQLATNVIEYHKLGLLGSSTEIMVKSEQHIMVNWVEAQLLWNPGQDPRKLFEEYCNTYFGAAGPDVLAAVDAIEASSRRVPRITLSGFGTAQEMMTEDVIDLCKKRFAQAAPKVTGVESQRLARMSDTIAFYSLLAQAYRSLYLAMDDRTPENQAAALAKLDDAQAFWEKNNLARCCSPFLPSGWIARVKRSTQAMGPVTAVPRKELVGADAQAKLKELFALTTAPESPEKVENLTWLPDLWKFKPDIYNKGKDQGWMAPGFDDSKWVSLAYNFFDNQGFLRVEGTFWYRTAFDAPVLPAGKRMIMRFGALDDDGIIYVNGKVAHTRDHVEARDWERSFEFDITDLVKAGGKNTVAVCGRNDYGKGGLWRPVAVYTK
jgi:hypothetical protein